MKKSIIAFLILIVAVSAPLMGCSKELDDSETNLIIEFYDAGYGKAGFEKLESEFEKKFPQYSVTLIPTPTLISSNIESMLCAGPLVTKVDLYFCGDLNIRALVNRGDKAVSGYPCVFEDLSDVYSATIDGGKTYKDKMLPYFEAYNNNDGKYYSTNWATGANGIAYRADYFEENKWEVPATTEELFELIDKMKGKEYVPFVWPGGTGYWAYATQVWWAQYAGKQQMENFYNGKDLYGDVSANCFYLPAFLETYQALEKCIGITENNFTGTLSFNNAQAQNYLYSDNKKICMMPNGEWLETEMSKAGYVKGEKNIRMMKAPLLSTVLKQTDVDGNKTWRFEGVRDEATLRAVVKAIDKGETSYANVSEKDFADILDMRNYVTTTGNLLQGIIPSYANAKNVAKEFLKFMATDEAMQLFYDSCGAILPFESKIVVPESSTQFSKDTAKMFENPNVLALKTSSNKLFYMTSLDYQVLIPELYIGSQSETDRLSGEEFFQKQYKDISNNWKIYVQNAN